MRRSGFTLIEVLAIILVLVLGIFSAIALLRYGVHLARDAQAAALALPTAMTVMRDVSPLGVPADDFAKDGADSWEGYVNGMWVERKVEDKTVVGDHVFATVRVDVSWGSDTSRVLSLRERVVLHAQP